MLFVIFWTALVRYTWLSNSSRFFFPTISTFGCFWSQWPTCLFIIMFVWAQRCGAGGCRREATWINLRIHVWWIDELLMNSQVLRTVLPLGFCRFPGHRPSIIRVVQVRPGTKEELHLFTIWRCPPGPKWAPNTTGYALCICIIYIYTIYIYTFRVLWDPLGWLFWDILSSQECYRQVWTWQDCSRYHSLCRKELIALPHHAYSRHCCLSLAWDPSSASSSMDRWESSHNPSESLSLMNQAQVMDVMWCHGPVLQCQTDHCLSIKWIG